ncbi:retinal pigment epithelial membrane protein-domain-containing protein [Kickxella alabastrina]|uniref:retinal pigment epithelial membrane protein-domain-containing protein n=1 Tax=Kickxella alabastrina TaxID=61397 RepID=UPI00221F6627|nr:retinal pigment epithelial membrane protein-domain-containing protein [Kickxella alabastrina]KAI7832040.1 retinal pigment epithelial membrane protein-domain-containing protein [Kickxella alabastrina]
MRETFSTLFILVCVQFDLVFYFILFSIKNHATYFFHLEMATEDSKSTLPAVEASATVHPELSGALKEQADSPATAKHAGRVYVAADEGSSDIKQTSSSQAKDTLAENKGNVGNTSDQDDFDSHVDVDIGADYDADAHVNTATEALRHTGIGETRSVEESLLSQTALSNALPRISASAQPDSYPLRASVATAVLLKDSEATRAFGARGFPNSNDSKIAVATETSAHVESSGSSRSSGFNQRARSSEIAELSEDEEADAEEAIEERQRRLFHLGEQRRKQKEKMSQTTVSSEEIEIMRSGFSNVREYTSPTKLRILNGSYPEGLRGSLYFVGPGRFEIGYNVQRELEQATRNFHFGHLMDALPLLSKISFDPKEKTITHRSRLIAKQAAGQIQMEHGISTKVPGALYMTDTNQTFLNKFIPKESHYATPEGECCGQDIQLFMPLQGSSQTIVCTNHVGALQNIDPVDLRPRATVELKDINPEFKGSLSCPHMQYDSDTREHFTVLQDVGFRSTTYTVLAISEAQPSGYVVASFVAQASVLHSFAITQDYIVVPVYPYTAPLGGVTYRWSDSLLDTLAFDSSQPVHLREYRRAPPFFALHQINATQDMASDSVSIDLVAYADDTLQINDLRKPNAHFSIPSGYAHRGVTMEATRYVESKGRPSIIPLATWPVELARVNPMAALRPCKYVYGLSHTERLKGLPVHVASATMYNCIVNDSAADPLVWARTHCYPSEPADKEDDGYIVSVFFDSVRITSCLLTFEELMIAQLPSAVPLSFGHSKFAI